MPACAPGHTTKSRFADEVLRCSRANVTKLLKAGRLIVDEHGHVNVEASMARIRETMGAPERSRIGAAASANRAVADGDIGPVVGRAFADARDQREHYLAETARLDFEERCGKLMQAEQVVHAVTNAATTLRTALEELATQIAPRLPVSREVQEQCRVLVTEHVEGLLAQLAAAFNKAASRGEA